MHRREKFFSFCLGNLLVERRKLSAADKIILSKINTLELRLHCAKGKLKRTNHRKMFLLAKLPQRETFYPIRAHQKVIDQNQNQNQTFDDRSIFAEILKTDRRAIAGSLRPRQIKLYSFADRSYRSEQSRFRAVPVPFLPPSTPGSENRRSRHGIS